MGAAGWAAEGCVPHRWGSKFRAQTEASLLAFVSWHRGNWELHQTVQGPGRTGRFQQRVKQNYFRNVLNLAVSTLGQKAADNLFFTFPFLLGFMVLQGWGSHCCADTRCGAQGPRNTLQFLWEPHSKVTCWVGRCFNRQETEGIKVGDQLLAVKVVPHEFISTWKKGAATGGREGYISTCRKGESSSLPRRKGKMQRGRVWINCAWLGGRERNLMSFKPGVQWPSHPRSHNTRAVVCARGGPQDCRYPDLSRAPGLSVTQSWSCSSLFLQSGWPGAISMPNWDFS